ncbi:hypothetical protein [Methylocapsa sp. S129]|uniref:hypothetical protein n=1 Tax=Methylocapsa sp. S129 TaxID=1641869 RepID=UPI00131CF027|nr:hypothetical protein [Methylocapsa sp. S129]
MNVDDAKIDRAAQTSVMRTARASLSPAIFSICLFGCVVLWFIVVDVYHRHFFEAGAIGVVDNAVRVAFVIILLWLIYAPGAALVAIVSPERSRSALPLAERLVCGFGAGVGLWHAVMLVLGLLGLYYWALVTSLCLVVLLASAAHLGTILSEARRHAASRLAELRRGRSIAQTIGAALVAVALFWLLIMRGLYPGGGGDYYTHYFYYYLAVLKNHSLAPNDVWYHYYYSKGAGLAFLSMLLTDPEGPALATYCCVAAAAMGILTLSRRMAPKSFWPVLGTLLYVFVNVMSVHANQGGEFQKDHEEATALIVLVGWALCMQPILGRRASLIIAASCSVAAAIITQAIGLVLAAFFAVLLVWSFMRRDWRGVAMYGTAATASGAVALAMLLISFLVTGLATDQALETMLRFANFSRLDQWGVIPQLPIVAWIRDNYGAVADPYGWNTVNQVAGFMRLDILGVYVAGVLIALSGVAILAAAPWRWDLPARRTLVVQGALVAIIFAVSIFTLRTHVAFINETAIFVVPSLAIVGLACCVAQPGLSRYRALNWAFRFALGLLLVGGVLASWRIKHDWLRRLLWNIASGERGDLGVITAAGVLLGVGGFATLAVISSRRGARDGGATRSPAGSAALQTLSILGALTAMLIVISAFAGHVQSTSFERLSTFFVPLLVLLGVACCGWLLTWPNPRWFDRSLRFALPVLLFGGVLLAWESADGWGGRVSSATANAVRFLDGRYSLADAYVHMVDSVFPFGAINPGALAASRQVPPGTPIWSTNVDSYCMAPGCLIESVASFTLSPRLDEILTGAPDLAKTLLTEAGVNYFLFMRDSRMIDILVHSRLFAPGVIDQYLGVKWTDGSTYLLTWRGPDTAELDPAFLDAYASRLAEPEHPLWFRFGGLVPYMAAATARLRSSVGGMAVSFPWRERAAGDVDVLSATYGGNCREAENDAFAAHPFGDGNVTSIVQHACRTGSTCALDLDPALWGRLAPRCAKTLSVDYRCAREDFRRTLRVEAEAEGKRIDFGCP